MVDLSRVPEGKQRHIVEMAGSYAQSKDIAKALDLSIGWVDQVRSAFKEEIIELKREADVEIRASIAERRENIVAQIVKRDEEALENVDMTAIKFSDLAPLRKTYLGEKSQTEITIRLDPETAKTIASTRALVRPSRALLPPMQIERVDD